MPLDQAANKHIVFLATMTNAIVSFSTFVVDVACVVASLVLFGFGKWEKRNWKLNLEQQGIEEQSRISTHLKPHFVKHVPLQWLCLWTVALCNGDPVLEDQKDRLPKPQAASHSSTCIASSWFLIPNKCVSATIRSPNHLTMGTCQRSTKHLLLCEVSFCALLNVFCWSSMRAD